MEIPLSSFSPSLSGSFYLYHAGVHSLVGSAQAYAHPIPLTANNITKFAKDRNESIVESGGHWSEGSNARTGKQKKQGREEITN